MVPIKQYYHQIWVYEWEDTDYSITAARRSVTDPPRNENNQYPLSLPANVFKKDQK